MTLQTVYCDDACLVWGHTRVVDELLFFPCVPEGITGQIWNIWVSALTG